MSHTIECMILFVVSLHFAVYSAKNSHWAYVILGALLMGISLFLLCIGLKP